MFLPRQLTELHISTLKCILTLCIAACLSSASSFPRTRSNLFILLGSWLAGSCPSWRVSKRAGKTARPCTARQPTVRKALFRTLQPSFKSKTTCHLRSFLHKSSNTYILLWTVSIRPYFPLSCTVCQFATRYFVTLANSSTFILLFKKKMVWATQGLLL